MIDRACISINNMCNLDCKYCHFHEKTESIEGKDMDVFLILDNIREHIMSHNIPAFKLGFVGNGEPFLDYDLMKEYILHISDLLESDRIKAYSITNGTCIDATMLRFLKEYKVDVGFSIDGPRDIHNLYRCNSFDFVMSSIALYRDIFDHYPSFNCTVGQEAINNPERIISFFEPFNSRITFSRMIGKLGIPMNEYRAFINIVQQRLNVRTGGYDCTMYGGLCGAGINNIFYANQRIYMCGNCIDLESLPYETPLDQVNFTVPSFDRHYCFKETCKS